MEFEDGDFEQDSSETGEEDANMSPDAASEVAAAEGNMPEERVW